MSDEDPVSYNPPTVLNSVTISLLQFEFVGSDSQGDAPAIVRKTPPPIRKTPPSIKKTRNVKMKSKWLVAVRVVFTRISLTL